MGVVWAAERLDSSEVVALKFVKEAANDPAQFRRLVREARAACAIHHPNVVQVHEVLELEGGVPALVMEVLEGESLATRLAREGELDLETTASIMLPVIAAVGTAHSLGIVHRDLKPENIFLAKSARGEEVKVLDFGIAKLAAIDDASLETAGLTGTGALIGTPYYMAPEQVFGETDVDHRADIWALGLVLYRCLSGLLPTERPNVGQVLKVILTRAIWPLADATPNLPKEVTGLVDRMLSKEREQRPADLTEVKRVLGRYAPGIEVAPFEHARVSRTPRPTRDSHSSPKRSASKRRGIAMALVLGAALGLVFSLALLQSEPTLAHDASTSRDESPVRAEPPRTPSLVPALRASEPPAASSTSPAPEPAPPPAKTRQKTKPVSPPGPAETEEPVDLRSPRALAKPTQDELLDRRR
jgi:serine/threonine-protein kinase